MNNVLYEACLLSQDDWLESLQIDYIETHTFSKQHKEKIANLYDRMRKDKYHHLTRTTVKILIVAAIILSIATTVIALPRPKKFITNKYRDHIVISIDDPKSISNNNEISVELPDGFTVSDEKTSKYFSYVTYIKSGETIYISRITEDSESTIDLEHTDIKTVTINGIEYTVATNKDKSNMNKSVYWNYNSNIYCVTSNIEENELLEICRTVK